MSLSSSSPQNISLQKPNSLPPELPPIDDYGQPLPQLLIEPRACQAGWGVSWLTKAYLLFKDQFLLWIGIGLVYFIILILGSIIPFVSFFFSFITFVFIGGIVMGAHAQAIGRELRFDHLFAAFSTHLLPLVILFMLYLVAIFAVIIPLGVISAIFIGLIGGFSDIASNGDIGGGLAIVLLLIFLIAVLAIIPIVMTIWFAPALVVLHDIEPVKAMKMSLRGCMKNIAPFVIFGLIGPIVMIVVAVFTLGLGLFALLPIGMITYYTSYRDVWTDQPLSVE